MNDGDEDVESHMDMKERRKKRMEHAVVGKREERHCRCGIVVVVVGLQRKN
jgi:hypothetical protein